MTEPQIEKFQKDFNKIYEILIAECEKGTITALKLYFDLLHRNENENNYNNNPPVQIIDDINNYLERN